jgi:hypothetical protein
MSQTATPTPAATLRHLLIKTAGAKSAAAGTENTPPSQHATDKLPDGNTSVTPSSYDAGQKALVDKATQANPVDGSKLDNGKGEHEVGLTRMTATDPTGVTVKQDTKKSANLTEMSFEDLLAYQDSIAVPAAAELVVKAANATTPAPVATPAAPTGELKAAAEQGAEEARLALTHQILSDVHKQAFLAADLFANFHKQSAEAQRNAVKPSVFPPPVRKSAKQLKKAEDMPGAAGAGGAPGGMPAEVPPEAGGGAMPPGGDAGVPPEMAAAMGGGEGGGAPGGGAEEALANMSPQQIEQLLMALLEQTGSASPEPLAQSEDPAAQQMAKQARAYLDEGRFEIRPVKSAEERTKLNEIKKYIRETTRS